MIKGESQITYDVYVDEILDLARQSPTGWEHGLNRPDALDRANEECRTEFLPALDAGDWLGAVLEAADELYYLALARHGDQIDAKGLARRIAARADALGLEERQIYRAAVAKFTCRYRIAGTKYDAFERAVVGLLLQRLEWSQAAVHVQDVTRTIMQDLEELQVVQV